MACLGLGISSGFTIISPVLVLSTAVSRPTPTPPHYPLNIQLRAHGQLLFAAWITKNGRSSRIGKSIRIPVRGEGVSPVLRMEPEGGRLDMGHVLEGDTQERQELSLLVSFFLLCSPCRMNLSILGESTAEVTYFRSKARARIRAIGSIY